MPRGTKGQINTHWPIVRRVYIHVDGTGTASITKGAQYATLTDNGTGDYTLALTYPGKQMVGAFPTVIGATAAHAQIAAISASSVNVLCFDLATPSAADADFLIAIDLVDTDKEF